MSDRNVTVTLDPVSMNVVNRIARGSRMSGPAEMSGGLLLQGQFRGDLVVRDGPLWIHEGAEISGGTVDVEGDVYVLGRVGRPDDSVQTVLRCSGVLHVSEIGTVFATMQCPRPIFYEGAQIKGSFETLQLSAA